MKKKMNYNYIFLFYDVGEKRVNKVFKICKQYLIHHQNSVFRGHITPSNFIELKHKLINVIEREADFITCIRMINDYSFSEETIGIKNEEQDCIIL